MEMQFSRRVSQRRLCGPCATRSTTATSLFKDRRAQERPTLAHVWLSISLPVARRLASPRTVTRRSTTYSTRWRRVASERHVEFLGQKKCTDGKDSTYYHGAHFENVAGPLAVERVHLVAGTAWAFGPEAMDQQLDYLFVDEAGQVSLPHAIAAMTSAKNVVLLGDPLQLPQVTQTQHPGDIGASVLEHLLGHELRPVAPNRGVLLTDSWRMHPDVCRFISELLYEGATVCQRPGAPECSVSRSERYWVEISARRALRQLAAL